MAVIDARDNVAVDLEVARSIGNIFSAIGRSESLRKKKYDMDTLMGQVAAGESVTDAMQITRESDQAPYDTGLKGMWQRLGNVASFGVRPDITEDMTEKMLMAGLQRELQMQDPMYQAQLEGAKTNIAGAKQNQQQSAEMFPIEKKAAESQAKVAEVKASVAPKQVEQDLEAGALNIEGSRMQNEASRQKLTTLPDMLRMDKQAAEFAAKANQQRLNMTQEEFEMEKENYTRGRILEDLKVQGILNENQFKAQMQPLELEQQKLHNKYLQAQTGYMERRGIGLTPNQRAAILKPMQEALSMTTDPAAAKTWAGIAKAAGFDISQNDAGQFVISDTEGAGGGIPQNTTTTGEQTDYSDVPMDDLLKSLMNNPF